MERVTEQKKACLWMIHHYMDLAEQSWDLYDNLEDYYLVYDHYMVAVDFWEAKLELLCE